MSTTALLPLSRHDPACLLALGPQGAITAGQFYADVLHLADQLPPGPYVLNTCHDRYAFMVGFGAALLSGRITLMPSSFTPATLQSLQQRYPGVLCLHDGQPLALDLPAWPMPALAPRPDAPPIPAPQIDAQQVAAIVFTSGSTGEPTAHAKRWGRLCINGAAEAQRLGSAGMCIAATVPAQHMYGFESSVLLALQGGSSVWRERPFYPADIQAALHAMPRPRMLVSTPFHLSTALASGLPMPACDLLLCATSPLSTELAAQAEQGFASALIEIYGCTESGQVASRRTIHGPAWQLLPGLSMQVQPDGAWVFGGHVEGRVRLSDHINKVQDDRFTLGDRHADMVNVAGKRSSLAALNAHLNAIDGVQDGCFLRPDPPAPDGVQRLAALVVAPQLEPAQILAALRQRIDPAFLPRPLLKVDRLPRNATGKLVAAELAALYRSLRLS